MTVMQGILIIVGCYILAAVTGVFIGRSIWKKFRPHNFQMKQGFKNYFKLLIRKGGSETIKQEITEKNLMKNLALGNTLKDNIGRPDKTGPVKINQIIHETPISERLEAAMQRWAQAKEESAVALENAKIARFEAEEKARILRELRRGSIREKKPALVIADKLAIIEAETPSTPETSIPVGTQESRANNY
jgi:hypothetical protein